MSRLTLGIDGWRLLGARTGVGRYLHELVRRWDARFVADRFDEIRLYTPRPLDRTDLALPATMTTRVLPPDARMLVWTNIALGPRVRDGVLFCPSFSRPLVTRCRTVVTIHEATYRLHPELHPRRGRLPLARAYLGLYGWSGRHTDAVIACSEAAREDVARGYSVPLERIHVVQLAPAEIFRPIDDAVAVADVRRRYLGDDIPFFLHVGKLSPVRNVPAVIEAFAQAKRNERLPHKLLLAGPDDPEADIDRIAAAHGVPGDCVRAGFVPDADLVLLYNAATAFVLPYAYQTVSLPPLEAMACGTPVITVGTDGMRDVTGGAAYYVSRPSAHDLADALTALAQDPGLARSLASKGLEYAGRLSWERAASETLDVLARVAGS